MGLGANKEWLESLKPGDEVATCIQPGWYRIGKVERRTKTLIITTIGRFKADTGWDPGNGWHRNCLTPVTDKIRHNIKCRKVGSDFDHLRIRWDEVTPAQLRRVEYMLDELAKLPNRR
jgi:hypothetical protein